MSGWEEMRGSARFLNGTSGAIIIKIEKDLNFFVFMTNISKY